MNTIQTPTPTVVRTERGLGIAGTRITAYDVMDYLAAGWPPRLIADRLNLSHEQIAGVLTYIESHRAEVEAEYQSVLAVAAENREYWEQRNRDWLDRAGKPKPGDGKEALREKLREWKTRLQERG